MLTLNSNVTGSHIWNPASASRRPVRRSLVIIFETITYQKGVGTKGERERNGGGWEEKIRKIRKEKEERKRRQKIESKQTRRGRRKRAKRKRRKERKRSLRAG